MTFQEKKEELAALNFVLLDFAAAAPALGRFFVDCRKAMELSQAQVAELIGKSRSHVNKAELHTSKMRIDQVLIYCMLYDVDMNLLKENLWRAVLCAPQKK